MSGSQIVLPGDVLGEATKFTPGSGTHIFKNQILASIAGKLRIDTTRDSNHKSRTIQTVSVSLDSPRNPPPLLPAEGTVVYARITQVQRIQALASILAIESTRPSSLSPIAATSASLTTAPSTPSAAPKSAVPAPTPHTTPCAFPLRGILRSQDVRLTEKDRVKMASSVCVGDIIRAVVVSLGDQGGYYLSTAGNELGVVLAWSHTSGNVCVPVSWKEVMDEGTGVREERKVAKPL